MQQAFVAQLGGSDAERQLSPPACMALVTCKAGGTKCTFCCLAIANGEDACLGAQGGVGGHTSRHPSPCTSPLGEIQKGRPSATVAVLTSRRGERASDQLSPIPGRKAHLNPGGFGTLNRLEGSLGCRASSHQQVQSSRSSKSLKSQPAYPTCSQILCWGSQTWSRNNMWVNIHTFGFLCLPVSKPFSTHLGHIFMFLSRAVMTCHLLYGCC